MESHSADNRVPTTVQPAQHLQTKKSSLAGGGTNNILLVNSNSNLL